ncbi:MAG: hypothetical protein M3Q06_05170 [Bacteroidota bacterium]|nr:hypothetical protein [Bacteroidota bacterium]
MKTVILCIFLPVVLLVQATSSNAQVQGCTDPAASNYNPAAAINDGSCTYKKTTYSPPVKIDPISPALEESSGLQWAGGSLWAFNDGGHAAVLFRIDTASAKILQTVVLAGATNIDWEDIAFDGTYLYIGDFGNNGGNRKDLAIYKLPLQEIPPPRTAKSVTIPADKIERIQFRYADQPQPSEAKSVNNTRFDCEAMIVEGEKIHLFTKNWVENNTTHYVIDYVKAGSYVAKPLETFATNYLVTAADKVPGSDSLLLIGYQVRGIGAHFMHLLTGFRDGLYFNGNKRRIDLPSVAEIGQVEGITFRNSRYGYISNEKFEHSRFGLTLSVSQKLHVFNIDAVPFQ